MRGSHGFTIIELVIVILVIGILASMSLPRVVDMTTAATDSMEKATVAAIQRGIEFQRLKDAVS